MFATEKHIVKFMCNLNRNELLYFFFRLCLKFDFAFVAGQECILFSSRFLMRTTHTNTAYTARMLWSGRMYRCIGEQ